MTNAKLLVTVILLQQGLSCAFWLMAASLRLARRPARHWAAATGLITAAMGLILLQGVASPWVTVVAANIAIIASLVAVRRGSQVFARIAATDREHLAVIGVGVATVVSCMLWGGSMMPLMVGASLLMAWTLLRTAAELRGSLAPEFGRSAALACASPLAAAGVLFVLRATLGPLVSEQAAASVSAPAAGNTGLLFAMMLFGLALNGTFMALVITRLVRRLQYQSEHDALTGLLGRRPMELLLQAEAMRQRRSGQPYGVLSIDIDHFKDINDRYGHAIGDAVLVLVARALRAVAREIDSVARMGGEEFCALLPGADRSGANQAAQRMIDAIRGLQCPEAGDSLKVTVSIGVAVVEGSHETTPAVLRRVDRAMYAAKAAGRDRIEIAPPPAPA